jgi:aminoglycoside phosphotransferase (APT) family kinase protein
VILKGAHAVEREAKVLTGLEKAGFPVAHVYGLCTDESVIGTWFYVMAMIEGRIFWDATVPGVPKEERAAIFDAMNTTVAQLHMIDYEAVGLGDDGGPGNYLPRQIGRWSNQYLADADAGHDQNMDRLIEWLPANVPVGDDASSIAHGDMRIDNMIFHPTEPRVLAVLDWELSTLGHPGADFAYHTMMYRMPSHIVAGLLGRTSPRSVSLARKTMSPLTAPVQAVTRCQATTSTAHSIFFASQPSSTASKAARYAAPLPLPKQGTA